MSMTPSEIPGGASADQWIGAWVSRHRQNDGLTQDQLAAELPLGWNGSTVTKIELGQRPLRASELACLAKALGWDVGTLPKKSVLDSLREENRERKAVDAERRAAGLLGVSVAELREASQRLWLHDLVTERSRRLRSRIEGGGATGRGAAGRVTRELTAELREAFTGRAA